MDPQYLIWSWIVAGIFLIISEFIIPGAVVIFLGLGALIVSLGLYLGLITGVIPSFITWFISSLFLIIVLRTIFQKFLPGETAVQNTNEDVDALGSIVEVIEAIGPQESGRIRFRETTWNASSAGKEIPAGSKAKIVYRDAINWVVEPYDPLEIESKKVEIEHNKDE